jgi:hypothetical protein
MSQAFKSFLRFYREIIHYFFLCLSIYLDFYSKYLELYQIIMLSIYNHIYNATVSHSLFLWFLLLNEKIFALKFIDIVIMTAYS